MAAQYVLIGEEGEKTPQTRKPFGLFARRHGALALFAIFVLSALGFSGGIAPVVFRTFPLASDAPRNFSDLPLDSYLRPSFQPRALPDTYSGAQQYENDILNSTLGFGRIVVLNLAHRHDKRDELSLMAKVSGMKLDFYHPILPAELRHEGLPPHIGGKKGLTPPNESAFRAHADLWRQIMEGPDETVLVLEDDIDWDVNIRESLKAVSAPMAQFAASETGSPAIVTKSNPWQHQAWDILHLGACVENGLWEDKAPKRADGALPFLRYADERTPDFGHWSHDFTTILPKYNVSQPGHGVVRDEQPRQRVLARAVGPACSASYALTRAGAARMLYHVTRQYDGDTDVSMANALVAKAVKGYIMMPSLMGQWRIEHSKGNSDLHFKNTQQDLAAQLQEPNLFDLQKGMNRDVRLSTRANLGKMIAALKD